MAEATLILHKGAREVSQEKLRQLPPPPAPTQTWFPLAHHRVLETTLDTLGDAGYRISRMRLALSPDNARFFGTLDLQTALTEGVGLAVGVRNSVDKTFPIGFAAGSRVVVCDNLAFRSELLVRRKHTRFGEVRFHAAIASAIQTLGSWKDQEVLRIQRLQETQLSEERAESLILRAYLQGIVTYRDLPRVCLHWRNPLFAEFEPRTAWSLFNCFTSVLADIAKRNPNEHAKRTLHLSGLLYPLAGSDGASLIPVVASGPARNVA